MSKNVNIFVQASDGRKLLTSMEQKMLVDGINISRTGEISRLTIGNDHGGVELEIPRQWVPDMVLHMALMLEREDTRKVMAELEDHIIK